VANIVEGTVQRAADKVRVNVQLIDARADNHLWAKSYDGDIKDIFAVETEVSEGIADVLQAKLSPAEAKSLATAPTNNPEAYDLFLRAERDEQEAEIGFKAEDFDRAKVLYEQAVKLEPTFAAAIARLAENQVLRHWFVTKLKDEQLAEVKALAERAVSLAPNLAASHIALGSYYYYSKRQYEDALREFRKALELQPNSVRAAELCAYIYRRQGEWERAMRELSKCEERDPRNSVLVANIGAGYINLRMWPEARQAGSRALALDPHSVSGMRSVIQSYLFGTGGIEQAKAIRATFPKELSRDAVGTIGNVSDVIGFDAYLQVFERRFADALKEKIVHSNDPAETRRQLAGRAAIHVLAGDTSPVAELEEARTLLEARLKELPGDSTAMTQLSWVYLASNRQADALRVAQEASDSLPVEKDAIGGILFLAGLAQVQAWAGKGDEATKNLQRLLSIPAGLTVSIAHLKIDPVWDPLRNDPRFQELLKMKEHVGP
jgi:serine/threonine-protein kinase